MRVMMHKGVMGGTRRELGLIRGEEVQKCPKE